MFRLDNIQARAKKPRVHKKLGRRLPLFGHILRISGEDRDSMSSEVEWRRVAITFKGKCMVKFGKMRRKIG